MTYKQNQAYRATTMGPNGMITAPHYLASQAGMKVLQNGGNAIEAAIAAASTISVVYPHMNSIGGDNFWLIYNAKTKKVEALNSSGRSGENASIDFYKELGFQKIPARGYLSANTVPGAVAGWDEAFRYSKQHLTSSFNWGELLQDAIHYAKEGFPVTPSQEHWTNVNLNEADSEFRHLQRFEEFSRTFLKPDGSPYKKGERMKQPDLATTLELIAEEGSDVFYEGVIAEKIVEDLQENGGVLTLTDFKNHQSNWVDAISVEYKGYTAYNLPPNTQGLASLSILNILNNFDLSTMKEGSKEYYHLLIEATKLAFADRDKWLTDPDFIDIPLDDLLSKSHGMDLANQINKQLSKEMEKQLDPKGDTVWFGVVDKEGNAVSFIQSIYHDFGSGIIPKGTGVLLQNRGSFFSLEPSDVNCLQPNKRTFHTLNPAMLLKGDSPYLVYGTMGGEGQPQTQAALVTRILDYQFDVQAAIEAPRWLYGRTWGASSNSLKVESRIPKETIQALEELGHDVEIVGDFTDVMGHAGAILIGDDGIKCGGADPRGDGAALGY
ncbi:gamma-glutamyltransferase [Alkalihalobacillus sp. MEB130]|uniref:gamma-glutamyltransferase n=1 Tax=Alkalihalobacillus sp. MEB130 TaxID=2976704 RepID=UPI0028DE15F5|nr:gamma-glutamyltransferase [Alkalihalobacillus sp. MEB130]MDT8860899.1 gamma-glutamyltransferase [Alkalihalobacillus sp. MEB130]